MKEEKIKQSIVGRKFKDLSLQANIAPQIQKVVISSKKKEIGLNGIRVILLLSANLKEKQIRKYQTGQLQLFDENWFEVDNDVLYNVQLNFRFADLLPAGNRNIESVKKGLDELQEFNQLIKFEREDKEGKKRNYQLKSSFISSYIMEEGKGIKITINKFWYRTLLNLTARYNSFLKSAIYGLSEKSLIFYFYLKSLPIIKNKDKEEFEEALKELKLFKGVKGTVLSTNKFLSIFDSKIKYKSHIEKDLLRPMRNELNKKMDLSFNWKWSDDDKKIILVAYDTKNTLEEKVDKVVVDDYRLIRSAVNYRARKYELSKTYVILLIEIYIKYTYAVVLLATDKKIALRGKKGREYFIVFQKLVEDYVKGEEVENPYDVNGIRKRLRNSFFKDESS